MTGNGNIVIMHIAGSNHGVMVHHIAQVALFLYSLLLDIFRNTINFSGAFVNIVPVG